MILQVLADRDDDVGAVDGGILHLLKYPAEHTASREAEVRELLGQARMHVVEVRHAERARQQHADDASLFVRMHEVVLLPARLPPGRDGEKRSSTSFVTEGPIRDAGRKWRAGRSDDAQIRQRDVGTRTDR